VAQSVECPTLNFSSGRNLRVVGSSPKSGSVLSMESAADSLSPSTPAPSPTHARALSLKQNKQIKL